MSATKQSIQPPHPSQVPQLEISANPPVLTGRRPRLAAARAGHSLHGEPVRALIAAAGGVYAGVGEGFGCSPRLVYFHDPRSRSTLALPVQGVTSDQVRHRLAESRESFARAQPQRQAARVHREGRQS